jgi:hypothetical protein
MGIWERGEERRIWERGEERRIWERGEESRIWERGERIGVWGREEKRIIFIGWRGDGKRLFVIGFLFHG